MHDVCDFNRLISIEGSQEAVIHSGDQVKLSDGLDEWLEKRRVATTTKRCAHEDNTLDEAFAMFHEEVAVFRFVEIFIITGASASPDNGVSPKKSFVTEIVVLRPRNFERLKHSFRDSQLRCLPCFSFLKVTVVEQVLPCSSSTIGPATHGLSWSIDRLK